MFFRLPIVKFFSRILNRITITVVLVALQVAWLLWAFFSLTTGRVWVNAGLQLLSLLMMLYLVRKDENSAYKIGWIVLMGVLPLLGGALYLSFGNKRPAKRLRNKLKAVDDAHKADLAQQPGQTDGLDASGLGMSRYLARYGRYPAWKNTAAQYFACGEAMYPQLLQDLERAEALARENRPGVYVHIYGKTVSKPKRKMGHVTFVGVTGEEYAAKWADRFVK